jgi:hypothetical protein
MKKIWIPLFASLLLGCSEGGGTKDTEKSPPINITISNVNGNEIEVKVSSEEAGDNVTVTTTVTQSDNETETECTVVNSDNVSDNVTCPDNVTAGLKLWLGY